MGIRYTMANHDFSNEESPVTNDYGYSFFDPSPDEIVINYWRDRTKESSRQARETLRMYDDLTLSLSVAYGDDWKNKLRRKFAKKTGEAVRSQAADESYGERL